MKVFLKILFFIPASILWAVVGFIIGLTVPAQSNRTTTAEKYAALKKKYEALKKQLNDKAIAEETEALLDKQIEETLKLYKENKALKTDLDYARALLREVLDNATEVSRQNAEDFLAKADK
ncbi:MAG: hypothetical protein K6B75_06025 [Lachnospiraceae bacterium]|nr:hypothetical protein [Lachnospiraceae bacterium]